ncbi:MAG: DUF6057 family protein [Planctomycetia bacterium]|nr:DUF6057 family protein [Planctomycetia bacterium]
MVSFLVFAAWYFGIHLGDLLYFAQYYDIFLPEIGFLTDHLSRPGGVLEYLTSFLIQFFHDPRTGGVLCAGMCGLITWLTASLFRLRGMGFPLAMIPAAILMIFVSHLGYFLFELSVIRFYVGVLPGCCAMFLIGLAGHRFRAAWTRSFWSAVLVILLTPGFGAFALSGGILSIFREWRDRQTTEGPGTLLRRTLPTLTAILLTPLICTSCVFPGQVTTDRMYTIGFLADTTDTIDMAGVSAFHSSRFSWLLIFLIVTMTVQMVIPLVGKRLYQRYAERRTRSGKTVISSRKGSFREISGRPDSRLLRWLIPISGTLVVSGLTISGSFRDTAFSDTLTMGRAVQSGDWNRVLEMEYGASRLSYPMIAMRNLAIFERGESADYYFAYRQSAGVVTDPVERMFLSRMFVEQVIRRYGLSRIADRSAMNQLVCANPSVGPLRILATNAMVRREYPLARRYLNVLRRTWFHRRWAERMSELADREERGESTGTEIPGSEMAEIAELRRREIHMDTFSRGMQSEAILTHRFTDLPLCAQDAASIRELQLICRLQNNDPETFVRFVETVLRDLGRRRIPRHFQEVLLLLSLDRPELGERYVYTPEVMRRFERLRPYLLEYRRDPGPDALERLRVILDRDYPDTFWRCAYEGMERPFDPTIK